MQRVNTFKPKPDACYKEDANKNVRMHTDAQESKVDSVHISVTNYAILKTFAGGCFLSLVTTDCATPGAWML